MGSQLLNWAILVISEHEFDIIQRELLVKKQVKHQKFGGYYDGIESDESVSMEDYGDITVYCLEIISFEFSWEDHVIFC